jgi:hypothetical protein
MTLSTSLRHLGAMTLRMMAFSITTLCIMMLSKMTFSISTLGISTLSIMTFNAYAEYCHIECHVCRLSQLSQIC